MDISVYPVGAKVWFWGSGVGAVPIQVCIETVSVWLDKNGTKIDYSFENPSNDRVLAGRRFDAVFETYAEAIGYRDRVLEIWRSYGDSRAACC